MTGYEVATVQSLGKRRRQEDAMSHAVSPRGRQVLVLADGMGGHAGGDKASRLCVDAAMGVLTDDEQPLKDVLKEALMAANRSIRDYAHAHPDAPGMGATLVSAVVEDGMLRWSSVGDSHLFVLRDGQLTKVNADHSMKPVLERMVRDGEITQEQAARDSTRHQLRSAIMGEDLELFEVSDRAVPVRAGDTILLASDGLDTLESGAIVADLTGSASLQDGLDRLIASAEARGMPNQDNISVLALRAPPLPAAAAATSDPGTAVQSKTAGKMPWAAAAVAALCLAAFLGASGFGWTQYRRVVDIGGVNAMQQERNDALAAEIHNLRSQISANAGRTADLRQALVSTDRRRIESFVEISAPSQEAEIAALWLDEQQTRESAIAALKSERADLQRALDALLSSTSLDDAIQSLLALKQTPLAPDALKAAGALEALLLKHKQNLITAREEMTAQQQLIAVLARSDLKAWMKALSRFAMLNAGTGVGAAAAEIADKLKELESDNAPAQP